MSGLEPIALALAAVSAGAGICSANVASKNNSSKAISARSTKIVLEQGHAIKQHASASGDAYAWANKSGAFAKSTSGKAAAVWSEDYYCKRK